MTFTYPSTSSSNETSSSFQGIIDAFNALREREGFDRKPYPPNYQGIIRAIVDLQNWGTAEVGEYPPGWDLEVDINGNITGGQYSPPPKNGDLWYDTRQGRLFIWLDDGFYQANGADGIPSFGATPPSAEVIGALWFNTGNDSLYIWDGTQWEQVTAPTGFSTSTLYLANPTIASFTSNGNTLPTPNLTTQEEYNVYLFTALRALEAAVEGVDEHQPVPVGTTNPETGNTGDLFYNTSNNTTYIWEDGGWHRIVPTPNLENYSVIQALQQADTDATAARQELQNAISTLENQPLKTYSLDSTNTTDGVSIDLVDNSNTTYAVELSGTNGIDVNYANGDIEIDGSTIGARIDAIEADYLTASSITNLTLTQAQHNTRITTARSKADTALSDIAALQAAVAALPTTSSVETKLSLAGGTMTGDINMDGHRILDLPDPAQASDPANKAYVDAREAAMRSDLVTKLGNAFSKININNNDVADAGIDFSGSAVYGSKAMKFRTVAPSEQYATFGTSEVPFEYSWQYSGNESFNYIHNNSRVFAVSDKAYAKDLVLCAMSTNADGPVYNSQIDVRSKLAEIDTLKTRVDGLDVSASAGHNIYYSDVAPVTPLLQNGDLWFDSDDLRLSVRHGGAWVFPDRVEDTALKSALYNAVNTSTDYETLKVKLLAALI